MAKNVELGLDAPDFIEQSNASEAEVEVISLPPSVLNSACAE